MKSRVYCDIVNGTGMDRFAVGGIPSGLPLNCKITAEPVHIELIEQRKDRWTSQQCIKLGAGEWTAYEVNSRKSRTCKPVVRAKAESIPAAFTFSLNGQNKDINVGETGWVDIELDEVKSSEGTNRLKIAVSSGTVYFDWFDFE